MPRYKIVIDNAPLANEQEIARITTANLEAYAVDNLPPAEAERAKKSILAAVTISVGPVRPPGTVHAVASTECPDGLPNCRNCGDPEHAATCKAAGHCPHCGIRHGIAPARILAAHGYRLEPD